MPTNRWMGAYKFVFERGENLQDKCHCFYQHRCSPSMVFFTQRRDGRLRYSPPLPPGVEISATETTVNFTESYAVISITLSLYTVVVGEATTAQADTLTYTVTVNGGEVPVTGTTEFVTTFTLPETTLALSSPSMVSR